jgi:hypothetical protein
MIVSDFGRFDRIIANNFLLCDECNDIAWIIPEPEVLENDQNEYNHPLTKC